MRLPVVIAIVVLALVVGYVLGYAAALERHARRRGPP
jgi:hypothetical protein